uniref:Uncharacterized protein n=1 Tax=Rhizophora mucronata TaxID=61149 RepID=A0A2P2L1L4_RHIMU
MSDLCLGFLLHEASRRISFLLIFFCE